MLSLRMMAVSLLTVSFAACMEAGPSPGETSDTAGLSSPEALTDSQLPIPSSKIGTNALGAPGTIAFGTINTNGAKLSGTPNWTSVLNAIPLRYEVTITGESYFFSRYATTVTPMGTAEACQTDSIGGRLLISCVNSAGTATTPFVAFVTSKP
jgi:hypothetical protein